MKIDDPLFKSKAKITQEEAEKIALSFLPGKVEQCNPILECIGKAVYEFDIVNSSGREFKVGIDAEAGTLQDFYPEYGEMGESMN